MARYIDADELYKAAQKRIAEANEARMAVVDDEFLDLINDAFTEDVAPMAEWISVEERLPERELQEIMRINPLKVFPCLAVIKSDYYNIAYVSQAYSAEEGFIRGDSRLITERITHWMPLPDPPEGD